MDRKRANRRPYWLGRATKAMDAGAEGVALQYDLARTKIRGIALLGDRDNEWRALAVTVAAFNVRFTGEAAPEAAPEAAQPSGRLAEPERSFKARHVATDEAAAAYDTARKFLRRIDDGEEQEAQWRELEAQLRHFNERFSRDRTRVA